MRTRAGMLGILAMTLMSPALAERGRSLTETDNRLPIQVSEAERNLILTEMREFLHGLHSIQMALGRRDMAGVALAARPMGSVIDGLPAGMRERFPEAFMQMALGQHEVFDVIARDAEARKDPDVTLGQVAEALTYCSGCHDTYRLVVMRPAAKSGR